MDSENIAGKVIVVTGASSGMGEAAARYLAARGAKLMLGARRLERIEAVAGELRAAGHAAAALATDVTNRSEVAALVDAAVAQYGRIDVLINNAGIMPNSPLERLKVDDWDAMIDVNIKGVLYGIAAALPHMQKQKSGHVIITSSVAGHKVRPGSAVYSATKHAVRVIAEGFRQEMTPHNIRSTIISPGAVATELVGSITEADIQQASQRMFEIALPAESFARAVAYAISQPDNLGINEILFRPVAQEY